MTTRCGRTGAGRRTAQVGELRWFPKQLAEFSEKVSHVTWSNTEQPGRHTCASEVLGFVHSQ